SRVIDYTEYNYSSNNGRYVAGEYFKLNNPEDIAINVYDIVTDEIILSIPGYGSTIPDISFSPDDRYMAVAYEHQYKIEIWDLNEKQVVYEYHWHPQGPYWAVATSLDGNYIVAGTGRRIYLYESYWSKVSVPDNSIEATITYPNPAENIFNLEFDLTQDNITIIDIVDLSGAIVNEIDNNFLIAGHQAYSVDITNLPSGFYTLRILSGAFSFTGTVIKN
ncbi:T9SS type A sorting domain-containing protein, partial [Bacteroidota bacterium]